MAGINTLMASPSAGELANTKDFHQFTECKIEDSILKNMIDYIGRPISVDGGMVVGFNGESFHGVVVNDVCNYGIGVDTKSIAISQKGIRWVRSEDGLKNGDLVKIIGTGATAKFAKAIPSEVNIAVGKAVDNSITGNEGYTITKIDFNCNMIKSLTPTPAQA